MGNLRSYGAAVKQWGPGLSLGLLAAICWWAAITADSDSESTELVNYKQEPETPVLSVRRMPRSLQAPVADRALEPEIDAVIRQAPTDSCVLVQRPNQAIGKQHNADRPLLPASNQKLVTTFAALDRLGPDFRFRTTLKSQAAPTNGKLSGDLYLVGGGDPFLGTDDWWTQYDSVEGRSRTRLEDLADAVVDLGITEVEGSLIGDESLFDLARTGLWATRLVESNQSGPLSALSVNEGFVDWPEQFPGSSANRSPSDAPALHAATVLNQLLAERGVTVGGVSAGNATEGAVVRAAVESPPLTETITHINSFSSNIGAELLLKQLGVQASGSGTSEAGGVAVVEALEESDITTRGLQISDGSGLSEGNLVTCRTLSEILTTAGPDSAFADSLSISGERGSLQSTYVDTPAEGAVSAKTGTLNSVVALSGFVLPRDNGGDAISFVYVANAPTAAADPNTFAARDSLVLSIADYPEAPGLNVLSPLPARTK